MDRYEKYVVMDYVVKVFQNRSAFDSVFDKVLSWLESHGAGFLTAKKLDEQTRELIEGDVPSKLSGRSRSRYTNKIRLALMPWMEKSRDQYKRARPGMLEKNLRIITDQFRLTDQESLLFGMIVRYYNSKAVEDFWDEIARSILDGYSLLSIMTGLDRRTVSKSLERSGRLIVCGLLKPKNPLFSHSLKFEVTKTVMDALQQGGCDFERMRSIVLGASVPAQLSWEDFAHLGETPEHLLKFLHQVLKNHLPGVNILLHGPPGTGKTEFSKTLASRLNVPIFAVGEKDDEGEEPSRNERIVSLQLAQNFLRTDDQVMVLMDEMDDLFEQSLASVLFGGHRRSGSKVFANRLLEKNPVPVIWTINDVGSLDKAIIRRMALVIEMKVPPLSARTNLWRKMLAKHDISLTEKEVRDLALQEELSPAIAENAVQFARLTNGTVEDVRFATKGIVQAMQGQQRKRNLCAGPAEFNLNLVRTDTSLTELADGLTTAGSKAFSLCLYGPPGTGKSAYGRFLADYLGMDMMFRRASEIIDCYIGQTEKNIARMFEEAIEKDVLLILDEADTFLRDRDNATRSWEVSQVNEMLTRMEDHPLPFVCTTNLMKDLDQASLRRFTFKVEFLYLNSEQKERAFNHFFGLPAPPDLLEVGDLSAGDFAVVAKKANILGAHGNAERLVEFLHAEVGVRRSVAVPIGFRV